MAKEATRALTRTAAREWGLDKASRRYVGAGPDTPPATNALGRHGSSENDVAPVVLFLTRNDGQYLTGYSLTPDGGMIIDGAR